MVSQVQSWSPQPDPTPEIADDRRKAAPPLLESALAPGLAPASCTTTTWDTTGFRFRSARGARGRTTERHHLPIGGPKVLIRSGLLDGARPQGELVLEVRQHLVQVSDNERLAARGAVLDLVGLGRGRVGKRAAKMSLPPISKHMNAPDFAHRLSPLNATVSLGVAIGSQEASQYRRHQPITPSLQTLAVVRCSSGASTLPKRRPCLKHGAVRTPSWAALLCRLLRGENSMTRVTVTSPEAAHCR